MGRGGNACVFSLSLAGRVEKCRMSQAKPLFSEAGLAPLFRFFVTPLAFCFFAQKKLAHLSVVSRRRGAPVYAKCDLRFFNFRMSRISGPLVLKKVRMSRTVFSKLRSRLRSGTLTRVSRGPFDKKNTNFGYLFCCLPKMVGCLRPFATFSFSNGLLIFLGFANRGFGADHSTKIKGRCYLL